MVLLDRYLDEVGILNERGEPRPCMSLYVQLHRAALRALGKLEDHLDVRVPTLEEQLDELRRSG
ncbi:MAG TPA: hypothetical protein VKO84_04335 [Gaiellaceae bacterium]|nr:hypothetical protein [Gaiellaceae bacterium]